MPIDVKADTGRSSPDRGPDRPNPPALEERDPVSSSNPARPSLGLNLPFTEGSMDGATPRWSDVLAMARAAEDAGFDAVWVSDHVGFGDPSGDWGGAWECWTLLSAL